MLSLELSSMLLLNYLKSNIAIGAHFLNYGTEKSKCDPKYRHTSNKNDIGMNHMKVMYKD